MARFSANSQTDCEMPVYIYSKSEVCVLTCLLPFVATTERIKGSREKDE